MISTNILNVTKMASCYEQHVSILQTNQTHKILPINIQIFRNNVIQKQSIVTNKTNFI